MTLYQFIKWIEEEAKAQGIDIANAEIRYIDIPCDGPTTMTYDPDRGVEIS